MTKHCHWLQAETVWKMVSQDLKPIGSKYMFVSKGFATTRNCVADFAAKVSVSTVWFCSGLDSCQESLYRFGRNSRKV